MLKMLSRLLCRKGLHDFKVVPMPASLGTVVYMRCGACGTYRMPREEH